MRDKTGNAGLGQNAEKMKLKPQKARFVPNSGEPSKIFSKEQCKELVYETFGHDQLSFVAKLHVLACARWVC